MPLEKSVATVSSKKSLKDWLSSPALESEISRVIPKHLKSSHFMRVALTATMRNTDLLTCTQESVFKCLLDLAAIGLEADGRHAHLIPFKDNENKTVVCTLILDYKGLVKLILQSGNVSTIHADVVCLNDEFEYFFGTGQKLIHRPLLNGDRGPEIAAYSYIRMKDGTESFEVMGLDDLDAIRKRSKSGSKGPWVTDTNEMRKKTVFRRHSKWLPISPELTSAISKDDEESYGEQERFQKAKPAQARETTDDNTGGFMEELAEKELKAPEPTKDRKATPLEGFRNMIKGLNLPEEEVVKWAIENRLAEPSANTFESWTPDIFKQVGENAEMMTEDIRK